jgi:hypothetical protein
MRPHLGIGGAGKMRFRVGMKNRLDTRPAATAGREPQPLAVTHVLLAGRAICPIGGSSWNREIAAADDG